VYNPVGRCGGPPCGLDQADGHGLFAVGGDVYPVSNVDPAYAHAGWACTEWDGQPMKAQRLRVEVPCRFLCCEPVEP